MRATKAKRIRRWVNALADKLDMPEHKFENVTYQTKMMQLPNGKLHKYEVVNPIRLVPNCKRALYRRMKK